MRGARWVLLLAISAILCWLGFTYGAQRHTLDQQAPAKPDMLPAWISGASCDWYLRKTDQDGRTLVEFCAKSFKQEKDASQMRLEGVWLHLVHKDGNQFDLVERPFAVVQLGDDKMYADGEVKITLQVPTEGEPSHRLVAIHTSGVTFNLKTAVASTDRPADFTFEN